MDGGSARNRNIDSQVKRLQQANHLTRQNANHSKRVRGSDKSLLATPTVARNKKPFRLLSAREDRKSTRLNASHITRSRMPSSA